MYIKPTYINNGVYHIYNRGVAKNDIFHDNLDFERFLTTLSFYLDSTIKRRLSIINYEDLKFILGSKANKPYVEILGFCLMPNHFHLLLKQLIDNGVSIFMRKVSDSYARYYNTKYNRVGPLFQGRLKGVTIESDTQLLHVSRYIHLNPYVTNITKHPVDYPWSSYKYYQYQTKDRLCDSSMILSMCNGNQEYQCFVVDYAAYARELSVIKNLLLDTI